MRRGTFFVDRKVCKLLPDDLPLPQAEFNRRVWRWLDTCRHVRKPRGVFASVRADFVKGAVAGMGRTADAAIMRALTR